MGGSNLFTRTLDLLILETLRQGPTHGYAIGRHLNDRIRGILDPEEGVVYPALYRLNRKGFVESDWGETGTGCRACFYALTRRVRAALNKEKTRWEEHIRAVQGVLDPDEA